MNASMCVIVDDLCKVICEIVGQTKCNSKDVKMVNEGKKGECYSENVQTQRKCVNVKRADIVCHIIK